MRHIPVMQMGFQFRGSVGIPNHKIIKGQNKNFTMGYTHSLMPRAMARN